ncbi:MAG TPA: hypothetical protein DIU37_05900 [Opitutae bacterium]|nr:hypothetical protein [Opitutae bacterium]|tara:strand:- start:892 stop:1635 length:744 start_codon:yes stop_codon:yes gene_type:complete
MTQKESLILRTYGQTDIGLMRASNEDSYLLNDTIQIYAVADGLGGLPHGDLASQLSVETLEYLIAQVANHMTPDAWKRMFNHINQTVHNEGIKVNEELGMGSTLTAAFIRDDTLTIAHVGDTGVYLLRKGSQLQKLTEDHTMAQEIFNTLPPGETKELPDYYYHSLTRCMGQYGDLKTDVITQKLEPGDRILIYSDGVTKTLEDPEIHDYIALEDTPRALVDNIIRIARERGGPDNCTAIAIYVDEA